MSINKIAVVDIETTGPHYEEGDRIIQIGAIIIENGQIVARHSMLLNPEILIPDQIVQLTGITQAEVDKAPTFKSVVDLWYHRLKDCFFVAHNLDFDLSFLTYYFKEYGNYDYYPDGFDTVKLARIFLPEATGFNLTDLAQYLSLKFDKAHDALADAELTAHVLNEIAHRSMKLPVITRVELLRYLNQLSSQEKYIVKFANAFTFHDIEPKNDVVAKLIQPTRTEIKQVEYLRELWDKQNYLVIEQQRPFTLSQYVALVQASLDKQLLVVCSSTSQAEMIAATLPNDATILLQSASNYLHIEAFREMCKKITPEQMNQQEIIIVSAIIQWLSYTDDYNLRHLNLEIDILSILNKYVANSLSIHTHSTYKRVWKKAQSFQYLLVIDDAVNQMLTTLSLKNRSIIVLDVMRLFDKIQNLENIYFPISEWFTKLRLMMDRIRYSSEQKTSHNIIENGIEVINKLHNLLEYLKTLLKEQALTQESEFIEHYISKNSLFYQEIYQTIYILHQKFQNLMSSLQKENHAISKEDTMYMKHFEGCIYQILQTTELDSYWTIRAQKIQNEFYGIYLVKAFYAVSDDNVAWLSKARQSLILSDGGYLYRQPHGIDARMNLHKHQYLTISAPSNALQHTIQVPISYVEPNQDSAVYFNSIAEFIQDFSFEVASHIIIFATNRKAVVQLYEQLGKLKEYNVFAQGISGSLRKIRRRAQEVKQSIIIVLRHQAQSEGWSFPDKCSVILQHLPFVSLTDRRVLASADFAGYTPELLFQHFLLPHMCLELKHFMQYCTDCLKYNTVYLFDERVFTKYYSSALRENVENMINFEIIE